MVPPLLSWELFLLLCFSYGLSKPRRRLPAQTWSQRSYGCLPVCPRSLPSRGTPPAHSASSSHPPPQPQLAPGPASKADGPGADDLKRSRGTGHKGSPAIPAFRVPAASQEVWVDMGPPHRSPSFTEKSENPLFPPDVWGPTDNRAR